jgi:hypothetical protein
VSHPTEPLRWRDTETEVSDELRVLLAAADGDGPSAGQLASLEISLAPYLVASPALPKLPAPIAPTVAGVGATKLVGLVAIALVGGVGGLAWLVTGSEPVRVSASPVPSLQAEQHLATAPSVSGTIAPQTASATARAMAAPQALGTATPALRSAAAVTAIPREAELLQGAVDALNRGDGSRALALAERHHQLYPSGKYHQELERVAIEALLQTGRRGEAQARAERFLHNYPHSAHRVRIESLLARPPVR